MNPQTIARVFGVLYLITFITAITAYFYRPPRPSPASPSILKGVSGSIGGSYAGSCKRVAGDFHSRRLGGKGQGEGPRLSNRGPPPSSVIRCRSSKGEAAGAFPH
jgi:hypothetical protein